MKKKLLPHQFPDSRSKHQVNVKLSNRSMTKLIDLHRCFGEEQAISTLAADILELAIAQAHNDLPLYME